MADVIWSAVGPAPQTNGGLALSGRVNGIAKSSDYNGSGSSALYLASDGGGVWRATQFAGNAPGWQPLTDLVAAPVANRTWLSSIQSIVVAPNDPRLLYAGSGAGVLRSVDGGASWSLIPNSPYRATRIIVDPRSNETAVWACGDFGLAVSADGTGWGPATIDGFGFAIFTVDDLDWTLSADGKLFTIYAAVRDTAQGNDGSRNGIYMTTDQGGTWMATAIVPIDHDTGILVTPASFGKMSLGADHAPGSAVQPVAAFSKVSADWRRSPLLNIFMLKAGTWQPIGTDLPNGLDTQGGANQPITVTESGAVYFAVSGNYSPAVFQTLDGGAHWSDISSANGVQPHVDHHGLLFTNGALYDGNDGGIWRFTPKPNNQPGPGTWEHLNTAGLQTIEVQGAAIHPTDPGTVLEGSQDNGTALRVQGVWKTVQWGDRGRVRFAPGTTSAYSVTYGWFDHSNDSGATWAPVNLPAGEFAEGAMQNFEVDLFGTGRILIPGLHGTWLSKDKGGTWKKIAAALTGEPNGVTATAFSPNPANIYLAFGNGQIFRTVSEGINGDWVDISAGTAWAGTIVALATDPASADALYLITNAGTVWRTTNAGVVWQNITSELPTMPLNALTLAARPKDPYVFVGTSSGVYVCAAPATPHWRRLGAGLPYVRVTDLSYQIAGDILAAATYGRGMFEAPIGDLLVPTVHIGWHSGTSDCPVAPAEGQTLSVSSRVEGVTDLSGYSFIWTVGGAQLAAGESGTTSSIKVILPSPPAQVSLSVAVWDTDGFVGTDSRGLMPAPLSLAAAGEFFCKLKHLYMKLPFFLFPGDPARDGIRQPITEDELRGVLNISQQMVETAHRGLQFMERTKHPAIVGRVPLRIPMEVPTEVSAQAVGGEPVSPSHS